jgi:hypothetical protein
MAAEVCGRLEKQNWLNASMILTDVPATKSNTNGRITTIWSAFNVVASKKSSGRKYGKAAGKSVASAMRREKRGTLRSGKGGKGGKVTSRKQAIAIGLSEARAKGAKVPQKKTA